MDDAHRASSKLKLARLNEQRDDLGACLDRLLADSKAGRAYFKVYRVYTRKCIEGSNPSSPPYFKEKARIRVQAFLLL